MKTRQKLAKCAGPLDFFQRLARIWAEALEQASHKGQHFASSSPPDDVRSCFVNDTIWSEYTDLTEKSKLCKILEAHKDSMLVDVFGKADKDGLRPKFVVSLSRRQCSPCGYWHQTLRPCEHAIAAGHAVGWGSEGRKRLIERLFHPVWLSENFVASVTHPSFVPCRIPCPESLKTRDDFLPQPPLKSAMAAQTDEFQDMDALLQNKRKRRRERGGEGRAGGEPELLGGPNGDEEAAMLEQLYTSAGNRKKTCKVCGSVGHNKRSCTAL